MFRFFSALVCFLTFLPAAQAQFNFGAGGKTASKSALIPEVTVIAPGKPFTVALKLDHPAEWHSYYMNSGGVEQAPAVTWTLPEGFSAGPIQWPTPEVKDGFGGKSFVYTGSPVFLIEITPPATLTEGQTVTLSANATWQICKESCINEAKSFTLTLPTAAAAQVDTTLAPLFVEARAKLPHQEKWNVSAESKQGSDVIIRLKSPAVAALDPAKLEFIPNQPFLQPISAGGTATKQDDTLILTLKRRTTDITEHAIPQGPDLSGILKSDIGYNIPLTTIAEGAVVSAPLEIGSVLRTMLYMFLGGIILNLMPCVFPVIGLKIMGFVEQSGQDRKKIVMHGVLFTLGVLASFAVLSGILFAARAAVSSGGQAIGWGYQLQQPWVVLALMILMFVLALSMYGVFEIGTSATSVGGSLQSKKGLSGSFFSGALATVVATPCSAPLLGAAIATTLTFPAPLFFLSFSLMALGLSLPYLVLSIFPQLVNHLPRPGAWMESLKQGMSFLLFASAGYLLWVYAGQIGVEKLLPPIGGLTAIAIAAWIHGRWNVPYRTARARGIALVLTIAFAAGGVFLAKPPKASSMVWEKWSEQRVEQLTAEGKPVYIDFTAQWCATCQFNKAIAYNADVVDLIHKKGIVTLKADKTNPDPEIEKKLQELGRSAIPVNVLIVPGKEPIITPEVLTSSYLKELFEKEVK